LEGGLKAKHTFRELADKIWGDADMETGERSYGKGKIAWGISAREYLLSQKVATDFDILKNDSKTDFDYIHYKIGGSDIYFITNQTTERQKIEARFRISGKRPELWDALNGEIREAMAFTQEDGQSTVPLTLEPYGSIMVVFEEKIPGDKQGSAIRNYGDFETLAEISGEWTVNFNPKWGGPGSIVFPELVDWSAHPDLGIKYYSGEATYKKSFTWDSDSLRDQKYFLKLGTVKDVGIAEMKINGIDKGVVWTPPFRIDISKEIKNGENTLEIMVVNSWNNRVAGDQTFPNMKQYTKTNIDLKHDFRGRVKDEIPLETSGLLGPVSIERQLQ